MKKLIPIFAFAICLLVLNTILSIYLLPLKALEMTVPAAMAWLPPIWAILCASLFISEFRGKRIFSEDRFFWIARIGTISILVVSIFWTFITVESRVDRLTVSSRPSKLQIYELEKLIGSKCVVSQTSSGTQIWFKSDQRALDKAKVWATESGLQM